MISEILRPRPDSRAIGWMEGLTGEVAITAITLAELLAGVHRLPKGRRSSALAAKIDAALEPYRETREILPFDDRAAEQYAVILAARADAGLPIHTTDAQIAAICRAHGAACATPNSKDFIDTGVELVDPWGCVTRNRRGTRSRRLAGEAGHFRTEANIFCRSGRPWTYRARRRKSSTTTIGWMSAASRQRCAAYFRGKGALPTSGLS